MRAGGVEGMCALGVLRGMCALGVLRGMCEYLRISSIPQVAI